MIFFFNIGRYILLFYFLTIIFITVKKRKSNRKPKVNIQPLYVSFKIREMIVYSVCVKNELYLLFIDKTEKVWCTQFLENR